MKDLLDILHAARRFRQEGRPFVCVTVVKTSGSTYRRPGARMLVSEDGRLTGAVSGGCLEEDVAVRARQTLQEGRPRLVTYDTTSEEDILWGMGLGCAGVTHLWMEPIVPDTDFSLFDWLGRVIEENTPAALATVFAASGNLSDLSGARGFLTAGGQWESTLSGSPAEEAIRRRCQAALEEGKTRSEKLALEGGKLEMLVEFLHPPVSLTIFGGGHDALPVVALAAQLGWQVTVVDHRPAYACRERFPGAKAVLLAAPEEVPEKIQLQPASLVLLMTHNYLHDKALLRWLLSTPVQYIGLLGPWRRSERLLRELQEEEGLRLSEQDRQRLFAPVGVDIGAETPEEIALSILAEMQAVIRRRNAGFLRERKGPIHEGAKSANRFKII
ncbi:MAG: XdhC/CoxI family protein [Calditrichaeota bacterium]|nr:MAG: XdhC/CoxI family protein [Calditrichota bacterium]